MRNRRWRRSRRRWKRKRVSEQFSCTGNLPNLTRAKASCGEERHYFHTSEPSLVFTELGSKQQIRYVYNDGHEVQVGYGGA